MDNRNSMSVPTSQSSAYQPPTSTTPSSQPQMEDRIPVIAANPNSRNSPLDMASTVGSLLQTIPNISVGSIEDTLARIRAAQAQSGINPNLARMRENAISLMTSVPLTPYMYATAAESVDRKRTQPQIVPGVPAKRSAFIANTPVTNSINTDPSMLSMNFPFVQLAPAIAPSMAVTAESFHCPICLQLFRNPVSTICGHSFCQNCLTTALEVTKTCPSCDHILVGDDVSLNSKSAMMIPNRAAAKATQTIREQGEFQKIITKDKNSVTNNDVSVLVKNLVETPLSVDGLNTLILALYRKKSDLELGEKKKVSCLLNVLFDEMITKQENDLIAAKEHLDKLNEDKQEIMKISETMMAELALDSALSAAAHDDHAYCLYSPQSLPLSQNGTAAPLAQHTEAISLHIQKERIMKHFDGLTEIYKSIQRNESLETKKIVDVVLPEIQNTKLGAFGEVVRGVARYGDVVRIATLNYDIEGPPAQSIVSSLEFDKDGEFFVVAGVCRRIKLFDYQSVIDTPSSIHYPRAQLKCTSKISNVSWNPYHKNMLACSDYEGTVNVWDVANNHTLCSFQEHEKRCWSVSFNNVDPQIMASGGDDCKVKIWSINSNKSVLCIDTNVNVCCVNFSPVSRHHLVCGTADHSVLLYDIRSPAKALEIFRGHRKAVSYVRFLSETEIVSASTDSSLRVWSTRTGECERVLKGHLNEKNFVGLSSDRDHIVCGSENNRAYVYYKGLADPMIVYGVDSSVLGYGVPNEKDPGEGFVSSVCWKKNSGEIVVANSTGKVHVLRVM